MGVNYLAVLVASVVGFVIGMLWYSPLLFGKMWVKLMGFSNKDMKKAKEKGMGKTMLVMFVSILVMSYVLSYFLGALNVSDAIGGAFVGFMAWIGFLATSMLGNVLWGGKPFSLYLIDVLHYLVVIVVMGAILGVWV